MLGRVNKPHPGFDERRVPHEIEGRRSPMKFEPTSLPGIIRIVPTVHEDLRGYFIETWQARDFAEGGIDAEFVQENFSHSCKGTLRGLHYQIEQAQGRLVRVRPGRGVRRLGGSQKILAALRPVGR